MFCFARVRLQTRVQVRIPQGRAFIAMQMKSRRLPQALGIKAGWIIFPFPLLHRMKGNNSLSRIRDDAHRVTGDCQYLRIWEHVDTDPLARRPFRAPNLFPSNHTNNPSAWLSKCFDLGLDGERRSSKHGGR